MPTSLAHAFTYRAIRHGYYPIVGTMRVYVLSKVVLVLSRWDYPSIHPVLGRFERYVQVEGKVTDC